MTTQDQSRDGDDEDSDHSTIDIQEYRDKQVMIAKYLAANEGTGMTKRAIASELDDVGEGEVGAYTPDLMSGGFHAIRSEYRNGRNYYYAQFEWIKVGIILAVVFAVIGTVLGVYFGGVCETGGVNVL